MVRTSRGTPAPGFDLDNIDIDDMFADDGDALFDGLDIDLDQMGDITNNMGTEADASGDAAKAESKTAPAPAPTEEPKRRKTKRKPKSPVLLDEEEDEAPRKKRRSAKTGATKKKTSSKKEKEEVKTEVNSTTKSKSKVKATGMPPPLSRHPSSAPSTPSQGNVAAAGQFGGRTKRGQFALPLSRSSSDRQKVKSTKTAASKSASSKATPVISDGAASGVEKNKPRKGPTPVVPPAPTETPKAMPPPVFIPFVPPSNFCGLNSSNTLFYPFLPALPAEPSFKNRKQYPIMDRIHTSFMSHINTTSAAKQSNGGSPVADTENIFRLMLDTLKDLNPSGGQANASAQDDKKSMVSNAIGSSRHTVFGLENEKLAGDLFSVCSLLKRQFDFLKTNLSNMDRWCKENFSDADYNATFGSTESLKKQKEVATESVLSKFKKPLIRVKVKCSGFKEPKLSGPLFAFLPQASGSSSGPSDQGKEKKSSKKRKSATSVASLTTVTGTAALSVEKEVVVRTYPDLRPAKRRQLIVDHIAHTAKELEAACISRTASRCQAIERRHGELRKMVEEDEVLVIHTAAMWQYTEKAGYFADFTEEALRDTLRSVWAPEVKQNLVRDIPSTANEKTSRFRLEGADGENTSVSTGSSIFHGLQSLLVEESSDDDEDESDLQDINLDEAMNTSRLSLLLADVSDLTLDERAYMHVRRAGILLHHPPRTESTIGNESLVASPGIDSLGGRKDAEDDGDTGVGRCSLEGGDRLEDIVESMSADLRELNKVNNARASFLESITRSRLVVMRSARNKASEEAALVARCQHVLKRNKDSKVKTAKPKAAMKDEYALPW